MQILCKLLLTLGRKTIFRFIKKIQGILADTLIENRKGAFPVGLCAQIDRQHLSCRLRVGQSARSTDLLEFVIILHAVQLKFPSPQII